MKRLTVPARPDRIRVAESDWEEGKADYICECGCAYSEHVKVPGYEWLRRLCDGSLVKLGRF